MKDGTSLRIEGAEPARPCNPRRGRHKPASNMFSIIGIIVVFGAVVGGYLMEKGRMAVLLQPAELVIILGAGIGTILIANPPHILAKIGNGLIGAFKGSRYGKQWYLSSLKMMFD